MTERHDNKVLRHAGIVSMMTAISRVGGLVREQIMAYLFGTGVIQSAFVVAFRIPNLFRRLFGEGALSGAFIPVFTHTLAEEGQAAAAKFAARMMALQSTALGIIVALLMIVSWAIEPLFVPDSRWLTILPLARIMLPYALLICQAALISAMLNVHRKFAISSLTPVMLNLVWILALLTCPLVSSEPEVRIRYISYAILLAGVAQILFQLPALKQCGFRLAFDFSIKGWRESPRVRRTLWLLAPTALGAGIDQINMFVDGLMAFYAASWAPAAMEYADRIAYLPLGMFVTAFVTVLLPAYSTCVAQNDQQGFQLTMERALRNLAVIVAPAAAVMFFMAHELTSILYVWPGGKFNADSVVYTALAVMAFAPGLYAFSFQKCLTPAFFALQDTRTPLIISLFCIALNFTLNLLSIIFLPQLYKHVGLVSSTVFCSLLNGVIAATILRRRRGLPLYRNFLPTMAKAFAASLIMAAAARYVYVVCASFDPAAKLWQIGGMAAAGAVSAVVYFGLMYVIAPSDLREMAAGLRRRKKAA